MRITKKQKIGIGGLVLALCALVLDRCVFQTVPTAAGASIAQIDNSATTLSDASGRQTQPAQLGEGRGTSGLTKLTRDSSPDDGLDPSEVVDAFRPAASWSPAGGRETTASVSKASDFGTRHELKAVMAGVNGEGLVIIDSRCMRLGQSLEGFRLVSINSVSVILQSGKTSVELHLRNQ